MDEKELSIQECKSRMLDLLRRFDDFCQQHNLTYYLAYGSVLGAVRHNGFIPWDDDIDVSMPRKDYLKLIDLTREKNCPIKFCCGENTKNYFYYFGKIVDSETRLKYIYMRNEDWQGLFIDVFPMDLLSIPDNQISRVHNKVRRIVRLIKISGFKKYWPSNSLMKNIIKYPIYKYAQYKGNDYWIMKLKKYITKIKRCYKSTQKQYLFGWTILELEVFGKGKEVLFENIRVKIPQKEKVYLKELYGDYMKLPPENERISNHDFACYLR